MSSKDLDQFIETMDTLKTKLENDTNYAVLWLGECMDFLNNNDLQMAMWAHGQYLKVLERIDIQSYQRNGQILNDQLQKMLDE
ncbi:MAG: hypothetical protein APF84_08370 [Gracilibacter sp. BRH_c7a]|nr:MAG: hypothetical protein APF84_08370 [Gracilibacter sp. BRH_c7a]